MSLWTYEIMSKSRMTSCLKLLTVCRWWRLRRLRGSRGGPWNLHSDSRPDGLFVSMLVLLSALFLLIHLSTFSIRTLSAGRIAWGSRRPCSRAFVRLVLLFVVGRGLFW